MLSNSLPPHSLYQYLKENWPTPIVRRSEIKEFTKGLYSPRTLENLENRRKGPSGKFRHGKHVAYHVDSVIEWLDSRARCRG